MQSQGLWRVRIRTLRNGSSLSINHLLCFFIFNYLSRDNETKRLTFGGFSFSKGEDVLLFALSLWIKYLGILETQQLRTLWSGTETFTEMLIIVLCHYTLFKIKYSIVMFLVITYDLPSSYFLICADALEQTQKFSAQQKHKANVEMNQRNPCMRLSDAISRRVTVSRSRLLNVTYCSK